MEFEICVMECRIITLYSFILFNKVNDNDLIIIIIMNKRCGQTQKVYTRFKVIVSWFYDAV